tara:strand:+ start:442 stop:726 length:285 start_codon:yes stop_codon:yes gene_type:complete
MNKHITLMKKWIENPKAVSAEELREAHVATEAAYEAAAAVEAYIAKASYDAADLVYVTWAAAAAVRVANHDEDETVAQVSIVARWVETYEELTK